MEKVTIVIPVYKPEKKYLAEMFLSIMNQQYKDFDIVISDDDHNEELINNTIPKELLPKIKYIHNTGTHGIFGNLNNALFFADGEYIQIFCQDDVMLPTLLSNNFNCLVNHPEAEIVFTSCNFILDSGKKVSFDYNFINYIPSIISPEESGNYFTYFGCIPGNLSCVMFKKSLLDEIGFFNDTYKFAGDYEFWVRAAQTKKLIFSKERHLNIRNHGQSASIILGTFTRYNEIKNVHKYLIEHNNIPINKKTLKRYLHIHLFRSIVSFILRKNITLRFSDWTMIKELFDGDPYSPWMAFLAFMRPMPNDVKELKKYMEVIRK